MNSKQTTTNEINNAGGGSPSSTLNQQDVRLPISRYVLFFGLLIAGLTADLWTKYFFFSKSEYFDLARAEAGVAQTEHFWIGEIFGVQTATNAGALFGMGQGYSWLFATFSIIALIGLIVWLFVFKAAFDRWLTFALGMISGGILGNLYDRLGFGAMPSYPEAIRDNVRDWILFKIEGGPRMFDPWPNFNIADVLLVVGAALLFLHAIFSPVPDAGDASETDKAIESS